MKCSITYRVSGMTCGGCAISVRRAVEELDGVESAFVDLKSEWANIFFDDTFVDPRRLAQAIVAAGYQPEVVLAQ